MVTANADSHIWIDYVFLIVFAFRQILAADYLYCNPHRTWSTKRCAILLIIRVSRIKYYNEYLIGYFSLPFEVTQSELGLRT